MRRMLDPTKVGGIPSTIEFDKDGNRKVDKNLGVDGKLTLKSLVSASNPDGDITKELGGGGGNLYHHALRIKRDSSQDIVFDIYNKQSEQLTFATLKTALIDTQVSCSGYRRQDSKMWHALRLYLANNNTDIHVDLYTINDKIVSTSVGNVGGPAVLTDLVSPVS